MLRSLARLRSPARSLGQHRLLGAGSRCQICTQTPASAKRLDHIATEKRAAARSEADEASLHFLQERASALGLRLSLEERKLIVADADGDGDGKMSPEEWRHLVNQHAIGAHERSLIGQYILKTIDQYQGQHLLRWTARMGVCFFAVCGANVAGEAGMHVFGATVVGCVTGVTGSTFNAVLLSSPVAWVRDPGLLAAMIAVSLAGFYLWPLADRWMPAQSKECATVSGGQPSSGAQPESVVRYALESVALGSAAVVAAQQGIVVGLHPLTSACLAITIAFGGAARDVLCQRDVRLSSASGNQSYAVSAFAGGFVYVALRELHVWNCSGSSARLLSGGIPIGLRIVLSIGTSCAVRWIAWQQKPHDLFWSMETAADRNAAALRSLWGPSDSAAAGKGDPKS